MTLHLKPPLELPVPLQNGSSGHSADVKANGDGGVDLEIEGEDMEEALQ